MALVLYSYSSSEAEFLDKIQTKDLRVFLLAINMPLYSFVWRFQSRQTHATSYVFLQYTVKEKGGKPYRKPCPLPYCLRNPYRKTSSLRKLSRLCPETSTKLYVHKFGVCVYSVQKNSHPFSCLIGYTVRFPLIHHPRVPVLRLPILLGHYGGGGVEGRGGGKSQVKTYCYSLYNICTQLAYRLMCKRQNVSKVDTKKI